MSLEEVCAEVLGRVTPSEEERRRVYEIAEGVKRRLAEELSRVGLEAEVRVEGSVAKDTWLSGDADIDVFALLPPSVPREALKTTFMEAARRAASGYRQVERWAEHPYLECPLNGLRLNLVPCYRVEPGRWLSATDRTPYHTRYVLQRLNERMKGEVRLLKAFVRGIGCYGAEIKVGGFSGYLCELLAIHYGGFLETLREASEWRKPTIIDPEGYYRGREDEAAEIFQHPLIVVDPVDRGRNVASAVRVEKLSLFIAASRMFLRKPSLKFFFPPKREPAPPQQLINAIEARGTSLIAAAFNPIEAPPDVLWGQLYRAERAIGRLLRKNGFEVLRSGVWSDEKRVCILVYELGAGRLPGVVRHVGPPIWMVEHSQRFLEEHLGSERTLSGPTLEGDRWVVYLRRERRDAVQLLREKLGDGGVDVGVPRLLSESIKETLHVCSEGEIPRLCSKYVGFTQFLTDFLHGRPTWLG